MRSNHLEEIIGVERRPRRMREKGHSVTEEIRVTNKTKWSLYTQFELSGKLIAYLFIQVGHQHDTARHHHATTYGMRVGVGSKCHKCCPQAGKCY